VQGKVSSRRHRFALAGTGTAVVALVGASLALGIKLPTPDDTNSPIKLHAADGSFFDPYQPPYQYNDDCALGDLGGAVTDDVGFTPSSDGTAPNGSESDLFDGGDVLWVSKGGKQKVFEAPQGKGRKNGEQLEVGPNKVLGLKISRTETALPKSPTLRSLIKLKNPKNQATNWKLIWDSDFGADGDEWVRGSSSGDKKLTDSDRWFVYADTETGDGSDAPGTMVLYGKGGQKSTDIRNGIKDQDGCASFDLTVKIPAGETRYLLFYTEVHDGDDVGGAVDDAKKFNDQKLSKGLLKGVSDGIKHKVLNWDLG
jgi:hypothetical protein